jgi:hypothetical protein
MDQPVGGGKTLSRIPVSVLAGVFGSSGVAQRGGLAVGVRPPALHAAAAEYATGVIVARGYIYPTAEILYTVAVAIRWEKVCVIVITVVIAAGVGVSVSVSVIEVQARIGVITVVRGEYTIAVPVC